MPPSSPAASSPSFGGAASSGSASDGTPDERLLLVMDKLRFLASRLVARGSGDAEGGGDAKDGGEGRPAAFERVSRSGRRGRPLSPGEERMLLASWEVAVMEEGASGGMSSPSFSSTAGAWL